MKNKRHNSITSVAPEAELIKSGVIANENTIIFGFKKLALNAEFKIFRKLSELLARLFLFMSHDFIM